MRPLETHLTVCLVLNADKLAINDPKTGLESMSKPCVTLLLEVPPKRSWDFKKIFGQSSALFLPPKWVDPHSQHSTHVVAIHLTPGWMAWKHS